jgi:hypothetical protein
MATDTKVRAGVPEWFSLDGEAFVRQAYQRLLDRPADAVGLQNYASQLRSGISKAQLVAELESSPEGRMVARRRGSGAVSHVDPAGGVQQFRSPGVSNKPAGSAFNRDQGITRIQAGMEPVSVGRVSELLNMHGAAFVNSSYMTLFRRPADPEGLRRYGELLRSGFSRSFVLDALASSPEAGEKSANLAGLKELLAGYSKAQKRNLSGWYWRKVKGAESDLVPDREARMLALRCGEPETR